MRAQPRDAARSTAESPHDLVSIGGPNHGANLANLCVVPFDAACAEMRPGSLFLERLNRGDETPGEVDHTTIRSGADWVVRPTSSVMLAGATNLHVPGFNHSDLVKDPMVDATVDPIVRDLVLAALG
jgi:triacylglycerol lipase